MEGKPPLVLIHGMFGGTWCWDLYRQRLEAAQFKCFVPALRYHDLPIKEQPHPQLGTTSVLDYVEDLSAFIETLEEPPILIGHSMGGLLVQLLLARGYGRGGICLTPASPRGIIALSPSVLRTFWHALIQWQFWQKPIQPRFKEVKFGMLNCLLPEEQWQVFKKFGWESGKAIFEIGLWPFDRRKTTSIAFKELNHPLLFIASKYDRVTPAFAVRWTCKQYPNAELIELPNHAHWVLGEAGWEKIVDLMVEWIHQKFGN